MKRNRKEQREEAFTGLEAAIVLIAFIVVAAVFSYVMLGAGFFTTQKSQETVYSAIGQAATNMEVSGPVILQTNDTGFVKWANFTLILAAGGLPVDVNRVTYTLSTQEAIRQLNSTEVNYNWHNAGTTPNNLLERGEILEIGINNTYGSALIEENNPFTIEVKPSTGATLPISRYAPLTFDLNAVYEVY
ncbi:hypothetical protein RJ53_02360 [Methanocalculus chunghsingensis]|uniref:Flagellin n=1 Tax=Methanocalculus chunghsingensis TaxID=156457 RepID=A0A8J7W8Z0_9EURY|nr:flagellin [Methanocalculus chunghsingensis]MBR1368403.1 hypothetical protein [Methanocalculus chunghsingensis]